MASLTFGSSLITNLYYRRIFMIYEGTFITYLMNSCVLFAINYLYQHQHLQPKILKGQILFILDLVWFFETISFIFVKIKLFHTYCK